MKATAISKRFVQVLTICAVLCIFMVMGAAASYADSPLELSMSNVKVMNACDVEIDGNKLIVSDSDTNPDVWSSKLLIDTGLKLTPGEQYKISFNLSGENAVGEFFLCKGENIDVRYDETFTSEDGNRSITFTAFQPKLFIGMQVGNAGLFNSVTAEITDICKLSESEYPQLLRTENCTVSMKDGVITATDTSDNNDVWNSKLLYDAGVDLEIGKTYDLDFSLSGDNGVGEFFVCKSQDLNDRYDDTFVNAGGSRKVTFKAESEKLYIGMQFGNLGKGNSVSAKIGQASISTVDPYAINCTYAVKGNTITVIDLGSSNDVWDSKLTYDAGINLEVGKMYKIRLALSGDNGVGELFLCKSRDINDRYDATFFSANGEKTVVFIAESPKAYIGMQVGNLGAGNRVSATVSPAQLYYTDAPKAEELWLAENCSYEISKPDANNPIATDISVVDTSDNNDVWNSKLLYCLGEILEQGKRYAASFNLTGANGVGEFFFCKKDNLDDRYSYDNTVGDHTAIFTAEDTALYAGYQFGNIGKGNESTVSIFDIFRIPLQKNIENGYDSFQRDAITLTDTSDNNTEVWNSKALYDSGFELESGKTYTVSYTITGAQNNNGEAGQFFLCKSESYDNRYKRAGSNDDAFTNADGDGTFTFVADGTQLFFGIQCGTIGNGNSMTVSNISITPVEPVGLMMMRAVPLSLEMEDTEESESAEVPAEQLTEQPTEEPAEQPAEQLAEEPAEQPTEEPAEQPAEQPAEEPAEQPTEEPAEQPTEEPAEQPAEQNQGE